MKLTWGIELYNISNTQCKYYENAFICTYLAVLLLWCGQLVVLLVISIQVNIVWCFLLCLNVTKAPLMFRNSYSIFILTLLFCYYSFPYRNHKSYCKMFLNIFWLYIVSIWMQSFLTLLIITSLFLLKIMVQDWLNAKLLKRQWWQQRLKLYGAYVIDNLIK